jgi:tRNA G10  N-methylase Trm11
MTLGNQFKYSFVPGKNWKLSLAELASFLEARNQVFKVIESTPAFFTVETHAAIDPSTIDQLGGFIKIAMVFSDLPTREVEDAFLKEDKEAKTLVKETVRSSNIADQILTTSSKKFVFGVSVYDGEGSFRRVERTLQRNLGSVLKKELRDKGKRSRFMGFPKERRPQLSHVEVLRKNLVENRAEILFCIGKETTTLSLTVAVHNPFEFQIRDVGKPVQRRIFSIPPRLARIMVNLAFCTPGKTLVDPFCGVGAILQEALLAKAKVVGVDANPWCVAASKQNLGWLEKKCALDAADYTVLQGDSRRLTSIIQQKIDCIATEPDLGPALRQTATTAYALKIISRLQPLFCQFLREAYAVLKPGGRLALVTPYIRTRSGKPVGMPIQDIAVEIGFKIVHPFGGLPFKDDKTHKDMVEIVSFVDIAERHKVGREIHVFEKKA